VVNHFADHFMAEYKVDLRGDRMALQRLREAAERAKHELSTSSTPSQPAVHRRHRDGPST